jgi:hypothetical protein
MRVHAHHGKGEFVRLRLADKRGARIEEALDGWCSPGGDRPLRRHLRVAGAGGVARDVIDILDAESEPLQRAFRRRGNR